MKFSFKSHLTDGGVVPTDGKQDSSVALKLAAGMNPPRSCTGKFVSSKKIVCKPPKFAEVGIYEVSVSMNGVDFLPTTSSVIVHKDLSVTFQKPDLCDISGSRTPEAVALIPELFLVRGWIIDAAGLMSRCV